MTVPRRGRPAAIDKDAVVEAALRVIESNGVDGLTMKALAEELGVTPMASYRYVESKQVLLELVVGEVLSRHTVPGEGEWQDRLWELMWTSFQEVARYPGLADYLYHGTITDVGRQMLELGVDVLRSAGLSPAEARLAYSDIYAYMMGRLVLRSRALERGTPGKPRPVGKVPTLAELASDAHVKHGYDAMVRGLTTG